MTQSNTNQLARESIEDILALSPMQEGMLFHYLKAPRSSHYFEQLDLELTGVVEPGPFTRAWNYVVALNPTLRTVFRWEKVEKPVQAVLKRFDLQPRFHDFSSSCDKEALEQVQQVKTQDLGDKFDLHRVAFRVTLCTTGPDRHHMIISNHHILYDGWSNAVLLGEFFDAYRRLSRDESLTVVPKTPYKEFIKWFRRRDVQQEKEFWKEYLSGFETRSQLSIKHRSPREDVDAPDTRKHLVTLDPGIGLQIREFTREHRLTLAPVLYTAWGLLLQQYNNTRDILFGTTVSGRSARIKGIEQIAGLFINTLPLRVDAQPSHTVLDTVTRVSQAITQREKFELSSLVDIKTFAGLQESGELFDTIVVIHNYPTENGLMQSAGQLAVQSASMFETTHYDLTLGISTDDPVQLGFYYNPALFDQQAIEDMANHMMQTVRHMVFHPHKPLAALSILSVDEKQHMVTELNRTGSDPVAIEETPVHLVFQDRARHTPHAAAVVCDDHTLTYLGLNNRANRLARLLREKGARPGMVAGLMAERSVEMIAGMLAILKSGAAYLPLPPGNPPRRSLYMIETGRASLVLTQSSLYQKCAQILEQDNNKLDTNKEIIVIDSPEFFHNDPAADKTLENVNTPSDLAYVLFTSGTTGQPKGVMIEHRNLAYLVSGLNQRVYNRYSQSLNVAVVAPYGFDASVKQIFAALLLGHALHVVPEETRMDGGALLDYYQRHTVDVSDGTPTHIRFWTESMRERLSSLPVRHFLIGGEALPLQWLKDFFTIESTGDAPVITNVYGPTECTVDFTSFEISAQTISSLQTVPIGRPFPHASGFVLDSMGRLQPAGVPGELHISGKGVGRGYIGQDELTAQAFIPNPYLDGQVMYRTGDIVRWLPDRHLEYLGRQDHQVKIRGHRIELQEIEHMLLQHPAVDEAAVIDRTGNQDEKYLCAYITGHTAAIGQNNRPLSFEEAAREIANRLREHPDVETADTIVETGTNGQPSITAHITPSLRRAPLVKGKERYKIPNNLAVVHLNKNETDYLFREQFEICAYLKHGIRLNHGDCLVDVGSNIGLFSLFSHLYRKDMTVYAFEPNPYVHEIVQLNARVHGIKGKCFNCGLSSQDSDAQFTFYPRFSFLSGLYADVDDEKEMLRAYLDNEQEKGNIDLTEMERQSPQLLDELLAEKFGSRTLDVKLRTLSGIIEENSIQRIDLLKINVEKAELDVLMGVNASDWKRIKQVAMEVHDIDGRLGQVVALLEQNRFHVIVEQDWTFSQDVKTNYYVYAFNKQLMAQVHDSFDLQTAENTPIPSDTRMEFPAGPLLTPSELIDFLSCPSLVLFTPPQIVIRDPLAHEIETSADSVSTPALEPRPTAEPAQSAQHYPLAAPAVTLFRQFLADRLPEYMVPAFFVRMETLPLSSHGKIDRKQLPEPRSPQAAEVIAPRNKTEKQLIAVWSELLGIEPGKLSIDGNFFELGGHSLKATLMASKVHKLLDVRIPLAEIFNAPTIRKLSRYILSMTGPKKTYTAIQPAETKPYYPLSSAQKRLFILQQMDSGGTAYNMPQVVELEGTPDIPGLTRAFQQLIQRHECFRTSFQLQGDTPVQQILDHVDFQLIHIPALTTGESADAPVHVEKKFREFTRPFDLASPPLLRVGVMPSNLEAGVPALLFVDIHHIISDGISMDVFERDFHALYAGEELPPLAIQYKDFAQWQHGLGGEEKETLREQEKFWIDQFTPEVPVLNLPTDFPRPEIQAFEGDALFFEITPRETKALNQLAVSRGTTLYIVLLSAFNVLLSKLSGDEDIAVGAPIAGRPHAELHDIIGMFANTLVLRNFPKGQISFDHFVDNVKERTMQAVENQDYQFEDLVEKVAPQRSAGRNPLFDVVFTLQQRVHTGSPGQPPDKPGGKRSGQLDTAAANRYRGTFKNRIAKFDITLIGVEEDEGLSFILEYATRLFTPLSMTRFSVYFKRLLSIIANDSSLKLSEIELITPPGKREILKEFNDTQVPYPGDQTVDQLFSACVSQTPDHMVVVTHDQAVTYRELDARANRLAHTLIQSGVSKEDAVAIMAGPSIEMITGILGILKAGAAYLPINPEYPEQRKKYILNDSNARVLLTTGPADSYNVPVKIDLNQFGNPASLDTEEPGALAPATGHTFSNLAYVIYTSGSTGVPKGVMVEHRSVVRLVKNTNFVQFKPGERILQTGALEFDASTFEIWGALLNGLTLHLAPREDIVTAPVIKSLLRKYHISTIWLTAPLFNQLLQMDAAIFAPLTNLVVGGDALSPYHIGRVRGLYPRLNVINGYGPTENTTFSTTHHICKDYKNNIPIGRPINNSTAYVVDAYLRLQPVGIPGELVVGGHGAARGYLNSPDLTHKQFLPDPFVPGGYIYKTGDRTRFLPDGTIEFLGRMDHQVKIRGFRIEPKEIEDHLLELKDTPIRDAVVIVAGEHGDKYLCAYVVSPGTVDPSIVSPIKKELSNRLPSYMVPSYIVPLDKIPLTINGKVNRALLPPPVSAGQDTDDAPCDEVETGLARIWEEVLGLESRTVGVNTDFFDLGGHSLKATILVAKVQQTFDVKLPLMEIFRLPTIRELAQYIKQNKKDTAPAAAIERAPEKDFYLMSSGQKRLYILQQMEPGGIGYNIPFVLAVKGRLDLDRLNRVFNTLIVRHESFRTGFEEVNGEPFQRISPMSAVTFSVEYHDHIHDVSFHEDIEQTNCLGEVVPPAGFESLVSRFVRPFDLAVPPLMRAGVFKVHDAYHILMVDMHHLITDGVSVRNLVNDLTHCFRDAEPAPLALRYRDYAEWQNSPAHRESLQKQEQYWLNQFQNGVPVLRMPMDFDRPPVQAFEGSSILFSFENQETQALNRLAREHNVTLFALLFSIYNILLSKLSGQDDIVTGTPAAGRPHAGLEPVIGMFVNTLALRTFPQSQKTVTQFTREVNRVVMDALENQDYQFDDLVNHVVPDRDMNRNPIFDVLFEMHNMDIPRLELPGLTIIPVAHQDRVSKFDMNLQATETGGCLVFRLIYSVKLFTPATIYKIIDAFRAVTTQVIENPTLPIADIDIITQEEKDRLVGGNNKLEEQPAAAEIDADFDF